MIKNQSSTAVFFSLGKSSNHPPVAHPHHLGHKGLHGLDGFHRAVRDEEHHHERVEAADVPLEALAGDADAEDAAVVVVVERADAAVLAVVRRPALGVQARTLILGDGRLEN